YHGIPVRHLTKGDSSHAHCQIGPDCCTTCSPAHATCYKAQVTRTTHEFVRRAGLEAQKWSISFQSRIAGEPWISPYTDFEFERLPREGKKRLIVITPAFVTDCLETLEEIRMEGAEDFKAAGGESFQHIPCLNDQAVWIDFLEQRVRRWTQGQPLSAAQLAPRSV
ncbi:MAG: ferrochelatase, partial [Opitutae bacterium]|nr:ferrochelatase [Opitutae bacterium]